MEKDIFVVDRIEKNIAICENLIDGEKIEILVSKILGDITEGDVIVKEDEKYKLDIEKTIKRKIDMKLKFNSIW